MKKKLIHNWHLILSYYRVHLTVTLLSVLPTLCPVQLIQAVEITCFILILRVLLDFYLVSRLPVTYPKLHSIRWVC